MSRVYILAADRPLPDLQELSYYRQAVEELGYPIKPFRYELEEINLENFRACLKEHFFQGESLELWNIWLSGDVDQKRPPRFRGRLEDLDMDALEQFLTAGELCFTITI